MRTLRQILVSAAALALFISPATIALRAGAQDVVVPVYTTWQPDWDRYVYDTNHVMLGIVQDFAPYRLTIERRDGTVQTVDLKHGTVIFPTGDTPAVGERLALVGYYSKG